VTCGSSKTFNLAANCGSTSCPASFDWRALGKVTPVRNQGGVSGGWAGWDGSGRGTRDAGPPPRARVSPSARPLAVRDGARRPTPL
jgi:hypothetical protein